MQQNPSATATADKTIAVAFHRQTSPVGTLDHHVNAKTKSADLGLDPIAAIQQALHHVAFKSGLAGLEPLLFRFRLQRHGVFEMRYELVHVPIPGAAEGEENGRTRFASVKVSRALAKTVTYEVVTGVSEFSVNYLFVRDLATAAGLTAFSIVIAPFVYYVHEKAWDYYDATKARSPVAPALKLLPAAA